MALNLVNFVEDIKFNVKVKNSNLYLIKFFNGLNY